MVWKVKKASNRFLLLLFIFNCVIIKVDEGDNMKKIGIWLLFLVLLVPLKVSALEYSATLSGRDKFYEKDEKYLYGLLFTTLYIDIDNLENIASVDVYIKYDRNVIGLNDCSSFNFIGDFCGVHPDDRRIIFHYNGFASKEEISNYHFYHVTFTPIDQTPSVGTTTVEVSFENAIDKNQNPITIPSLTKTYTFAQYHLPVVPPVSPEESSDKKEDDKQDELLLPKVEDKENNITIPSNNNKQEIINKPVVKSDNNYAKEIKIENYKIAFDRNTKEYSIEIDPNINSLNVFVDLEHSKSSYQVIGADDLQNNDYKVFIRVVSESGKTNEYTIHTKMKQPEQNLEGKEENVPNSIETKSSKGFNFNKVMIIGGSISIILIVILLILL